MNEQINKLKDAKQRLLNEICKQVGHSYQEWSEENNNESIIYKRTCSKCGYLEIIKTSTKLEEIEQEIQKQNKGKQLLDYLLNSNKESLTKENLLFYLFITKDYINYINKNNLKEILIKYNTPSIESLDEYTLLKQFTDSIYNIDDELWDNIQNYITEKYQERSIQTK